MEYITYPQAVFSIVCMLYVATYSTVSSVYIIICKEHTYVQHGFVFDPPMHNTQ